MVRSLFAISVNEGRMVGYADQHCSINFLHSGSHVSGTLGRRVFCTIPPATKVDIHIRHYISIIILILKQYVKYNIVTYYYNTSKIYNNTNIICLNTIYSIS